LVLKEEFASSTWTAPAHGKAFSKFVDTMLTFVERQKKGSSAQLVIQSIDGLALLNYITKEFDEQVCALRVANKGEFNL